MPLLAISSVVLSSNDTFSGTVSLFSTCEDVHTVKKSETVFSGTETKNTVKSSIRLDDRRSVFRNLTSLSNLVSSLHVRKMIRV